MRPVGRSGRGFLLALAALAPAAGCTPGNGGTDQVPAVDASTYVAAIDGFLPPAQGPDERPVVYVVPVADESLALDTQVKVIAALAESYDMRFLDSYEAAVDEGSSDEPPRDDGTLIGLGIVAEQPPHTVRIERYAGRDRVEAHLVTMAFRGGRWTVVRDDPVEPEALIGGE